MPSRYPVIVPKEKSEAIRVGLCASCRFMRRMQSDRGSTFYLCQLSATDVRFPKYPRLPVLRCSGYTRAAGDEKIERDDPLQ